MTLAQAITLVLRRTGLSTSVEGLQDQARTYLSLSVAEIVPMVPWWWLDRTTTFATVASTRTYSPVSANVTAWHSFVDVTNDRPLTIVGPDEYDLLDLDQGDTGTVEAVFLAGMDTSTGYPEIELWRTPSAVATIRVRYRIDIDEWTSSNDASDFITLGIPRIVESILVHGATALYMEEEGDDSSARLERARHQAALAMARRQHGNMQGNRNYPPIRNRAGGDLFLRIGSGAASAP
tara:strand:- start:154 stop:861 length:708 start_codon:yes stop_codon:yes gene_type:complete